MDKGSLPARALGPSFPQWPWGQQTTGRASRKRTVTAGFVHHCLAATEAGAFCSRVHPISGDPEPWGTQLAHCAPAWAPRHPGTPGAQRPPRALSTASGGRSPRALGPAAGTGSELEPGSPSVPAREHPGSMWEPGPCPSPALSSGLTTPLLTRAHPAHQASVPGRDHSVPSGRRQPRRLCPLPAGPWGPFAGALGCGFSVSLAGRVSRRAKKAFRARGEKVRRRHRVSRLWEGWAGGSVAWGLPGKRQGGPLAPTPRSLPLHWRTRAGAILGPPGQDGSPTPPAPPWLLAGWLRLTLTVPIPVPAGTREPSPAQDRGDKEPRWKGSGARARWWVTEEAPQEPEDLGTGART